jgi:hypothetical protein
MFWCNDLMVVMTYAQVQNKIPDLNDRKKKLCALENINIHVCFSNGDVSYKEKCI